MRKIKFCHLIDASGINSLLFESVKFSSRAKIEYTVISLAAKGGLHEQLKGLGVESYSLDCSSRKRYVSTIFRLLRILRREQFDIIQVHSFEASFVGLIAAKIAGVPVRLFSGHHSHEVPLYSNRRLLLLDGFLGKRLATTVCAPSKNMKDIFVEAEGVPKEKIKVLYHGMDFNGWMKSAGIECKIREEYGLENKIIIGAVGRLFWVKNFDVLIRAFATVVEEHDDVVLLIVGDGLERDALQALIDSLGLTDRAILIGKRTDIAAVMSNFDIFVHPSRAESFGLVYIEVMALAKPVVATKFGIAPEIIQHGVNGFLVNSEPDEMAATLSRVLEIRKEWNTIGERGRQTIEKFSIHLTQAECDSFVISLLPGNV